MTEAAPAEVRRTVNAYNTAHASENKIHDNETAKRFGFAGGLVPGVDVFAYMAYPALATWGRGWLQGGRLSARFAKPVYDGEDVLVQASGTSPMRIEVRHGDTVCAQGEASMDAGEHGIGGPDIPRAPLSDERPPASPVSLAKGQVMGSLELVFDAVEGRDYLRDVREDHVFFEDGAVAHPGWLLRRANRILAANVQLGPWIHVSSDARFLAPLRAGDSLSVRGTVLDNYEHKGHLFVDLDVLLLAGAGNAVMRALHRAIYAPRQVREGAGG